MKQSIVFQRFEGLSIFIASLYIYMRLDFSLLLFVLLILSIDIFMLGYLLGDKIGAYAYNLGHSLPIPLVLGVVGYITGADMAIALSLIWLAHIGLDRTFGYGLKLASGFKDTHLGRIGKNDG